MEETKINQHNENGQREGRWEFYHDNGQLKAAGNYKAGEKRREI